MYVDFLFSTFSPRDLKPQPELGTHSHKARKMVFTSVRDTIHTHSLTLLATLRVLYFHRQVRHSHEVKHLAFYLTCGVINDQSSQSILLKKCM